MSLAYAPDRTQAQAAELNAKLRHVHPREVLTAAVVEFGDKLALVSSFGAESAVLLDLAAQADPNITVLFLDTGMQFDQTLDYRRQLAERLGLTGVRDLRPSYQDLATTDPSANLWQTDTDACCHIRKVLPLDRALKDFDAWITGRKRFHEGDRLNLPVVEVSDGKIKFNPLANWAKAELDAYVADRELPPHPLVAQGFPSIGCWPCTQQAEEGEDVRAGRWKGQDKTECGIRLARTPGVPNNVGGDI